MKRDRCTQPQVKQRVCAALKCRRRTGLVETKVLTLGNILAVDLCEEHRDCEDAALHKKFRDTYGVDFVDGDDEEPPE